jgi:hypothetical protein
MLQPIPIPSQPFEVVSMDFIPELPVSNGYDNILVIVDKLTKYTLFIPMTTTITEKGTAVTFLPPHYYPIWYSLASHFRSRYLMERGILEGNMEPDGN